MDLALALDSRAELGEGPLWDAARGCLWWVDILGSAVHAFDPTSGVDRAIPVGEHVGTVVTRRDGGLLLALRHGFAACDPLTGQLERWGDPECGRAELRFNDGKCDPQGRFWAGSMAYDGTAGAGSLWRLDPDRSLRRVLADVTISNGVAWDVRRSIFYHIDSPTRCVSAFAFDPSTGSLSDRRTAITCAPEDGFPDGCAIDAEGLLWIAHWGGGQVVRWDPHSGRAVQRVRVPVSQPTAVAFAGSRLFITSARTGLSPADLTREPHAGGIFTAETGVTGAPTYAFAG